MPSTTLTPPVRPDRDAGRWAPTGRTVAALAVTGLLVVGQMYVVLPLFGPMGRTFGVPADRLTWLATAFGGAYAIGFLISGPLADRYGPRRVITVGLVATAAMTAAVAAAPTLAAATALRALQGLAAATFAPAAVAYISEHIEPARRAIAITFLSSGYLAAAVVMQVGAQVLTAAVGWPSVFLAGAACLLVVFAVNRSALRRDDRTPAATAASAFAAMPRLLTRPRLLALYGATATVLGGFVAVYTAVTLAGPPSVAGNPTALLALRASALPAMLALPAITIGLARFGASGRITAGLGTAAVTAFAASFVGHDVIALAVVLLVFVAGIGTAAPALMETVAGRTDATTRGAAVAVYAFAMFVGASLGPQLAGAMAGSGFGAVVRTIAACLAAGTLLAVFGARSRR